MWETYFCVRFETRNGRLKLLQSFWYTLYYANPSGRAIVGVGLRSLACWGCGFESRRGYGRLSLVSVVYCRVEVSAPGWSLVHRSPIECGVSDCDHETSLMRKPWSNGGCCTMVKILCENIMGFLLGGVLFESRLKYQLYWVKFLWLSWVPPNLFRGGASIRPRHLTFKSFPVYLSSVILSFDSVWDSVVICKP